MNDKLKDIFANAQLLVNPETLSDLESADKAFIIAAIKEIPQLYAFKAYWDGLYGEGLEVANWHLSGNLEPFDEFYHSAICTWTGKEV